MNKSNIPYRKNLFSDFQCYRYIFGITLKFKSYEVLFEVKVLRNMININYIVSFYINEKVEWAYYGVCEI